MTIPAFRICISQCKPWPMTNSYLVNLFIVKFDGEIQNCDECYLVYVQVQILLTLFRRTEILASSER